MLVVALLFAGSARADVEAEFAACKARRRELTREAMKIEDVIERGRKLALMPICRRFGDRSTEIVGPLPPPLPPSPISLLEVRPQVGLVLGIGSYAIGTSMALPVTTAPFVELEAGGRLRGVSIVGFGGYSGIDTGFTYYDPSVLRYGRYDSHNTISDGGIKVRVGTGRVAFGAGIGVEEERERGVSTISGPHDMMYELALFEGDIGYAIVAPAGFAVRLRAIVSAAAGDGTVASARFALAVER